MMKSVSELSELPVLSGDKSPVSSPPSLRDDPLSTSMVSVNLNSEKSVSQNKSTPSSVSKQPSTPMRRESSNSIDSERDVDTYEANGADDISFGSRRSSGNFSDRSSGHTDPQVGLFVVANKVHELEQHAAEAEHKEKREGIFLGVTGICAGLILILGCIFLIVDMYTLEQPEEAPETTDVPTIVKFLLAQQQQKNKASWAVQAGNWCIFISAFCFIFTICAHGFRRCRAAINKQAEKDKKAGKTISVGHWIARVGHAFPEIFEAAMFNRDFDDLSQSGISPHSVAKKGKESSKSEKSRSEKSKSKSKSDPALEASLSNVLANPTTDAKSRYARAYGAYNPAGHGRYQALRNNYGKNYYL